MMLLLYHSWYLRLKLSISARGIKTTLYKRLATLIENNFRAEWSLATVNSQLLKAWKVASFQQLTIWNSILFPKLSHFQVLIDLREEMYVTNNKTGTSIRQMRQMSQINY